MLARRCPSRSTVTTAAAGFVASGGAAAASALGSRPAMTPALALLRPAPRLSGSLPRRPAAGPPAAAGQVNVSLKASYKRLAWCVLQRTGMRCK